MSPIACPILTPRTDLPTHTHVWAVCDTVHLRLVTAGGDPRYRNATFNTGGYGGEHGRYIYFSGASVLEAC